jgi:hypothetical protein
MNASDKCRVSECDRYSAASVLRDDFPGPLPLCATHTEDFRQNGAGWKIDWERGAPEPTSITIAASSDVGFTGPRPAQTSVQEQTSPPSGLKALLRFPGRASRKRQT